MTFRYDSSRSMIRLNKRLRVEVLEGRDVPSASVAPLNSTDIVATVLEGEETFFSLNNSGNSRVDPNTTSSPFAGVGSVLVTTKRSSFIGTATAISPRHIITAAHVVDLNNDGKVNNRDKTTGVYFILNYGEDESHRIAIEQFDIQPNFRGFNRPAINDDIAILTLSEDLPDGVPIYPVANFDMVVGTLITIVGYGRSGDGVVGYDTDASLTVKRVGENVVDAFYIQDDRKMPIVNEVFRFDFDSPTGTGPLGGYAVQRETQIGPGDSGGPSFVSTPMGYTLAGINTFVQGRKAPKYDSMGGGMNLYYYLDFINSIINPGKLGPLEISDAAPPVAGPPNVPIIGPIIGLPAKKGIRVGAKKVSGEFAIEVSKDAVVSRTEYRQSPTSGISDKPTEREASDISIPVTRETSAYAGWNLDSSAFRFDLRPDRDSIPIGNALFEFASGEVLSV